MAASSWVSTRRRASRVALTAKATLVSSTRPSGTMATRPATEACTAWWTLRSARIWAQMSRAAAGIMAQPIQVIRRLTPSRSSEWTSE